MSVEIQSSVREAKIGPLEATRLGRKRSGRRHLDLQREAMRRRRRSQMLLATSLAVLGGLFALFYELLIS